MPTFDNKPVRLRKNIQNPLDPTYFFNGKELGDIAGSKPKKLFVRPNEKQHILDVSDIPGALPQQRH